jgi:L-amino acid N-acyltransferase YncA
LKIGGRHQLAVLWVAAVRAMLVRTGSRRPSSQVPPLGSVLRDDEAIDAITRRIFHGGRLCPMPNLVKRLVFPAWRFVAGLHRPSKAANTRLLRERGETVDALVIRHATVADIPALAQLHVTTWNDTYAPMMLKGPDVAVRERQWREAFAELDRRWFCLVVENPSGTLVGFAKGTPSDHPEYAGQLSKIFLRREYQRVGLGRRLMGHVARRFLAQGISSMWLTGDARNPSCHFHTRLGAVKTDQDPGNGNYGWRDLRKLSSICPP